MKTLHTLSALTGIVCLGVTLQAQLPPVTAEVYKFAPMRKFGTNIYDFAPVISDELRGVPGSAKYLVQGRVLNIKIPKVPGGTVIESRFGPARYEYSAPSASDLQYADDQDLFGMLAASQLSRKNRGTISLGEYLALSPGMRSNFRLVQPVGQILVGNLPKIMRTPGRTVHFFALPYGRFDPRTGRFGPVGMPYYDFGKKFVGSLTNFQRVWLVTRNGTIEKRLSKSNGNRKQKAKNRGARRVIKWQLNQATNGSAYAQFEVAKRYLNGDGVKTNRTLAYHWLRLSAQQGYSPAIKLRESIVLSKHQWILRAVK